MSSLYPNKLVYISLGWGVQSFTFTAMSALDEAEPIDYAIFSDTTYERKATYLFAKKWSPWLIDHGIKLITVTNQGKQSGILDSAGNCSLAAFNINQQGGQGQLRKQCTTKWKRAPIRRWLQANRHGKPVIEFKGISTDEAERMKPSDVKYITTRWPLIEMGMSRNDCKIWLLAHNLEIPPKSACAHCPYHTKEEWIEISNNPDDFANAIKVDNLIRDNKDNYQLFIHRARKPLVEVNFKKEADQLSLWGEECDGLCGV